jgi:hypothetical protein
MKQLSESVTLPNDDWAATGLFLRSLTVLAIE